MKEKIIPLIFLCFAVFIFFKAFLVNGLLPIPSDTIVGLYHPFRDFYAKDYPNGIPFKNFLITDPVRQIYPWKNLAITLEKQGQIPLWNPYSFAGYPLLANFQSSPFYPLNIIFLIFSFSTAWSIFILLQPILAAVFLYLYLNHLKLDKRASVLGSLTFAFCGFSVSWLEWGTIIHAALWLPLILLAIDKIFTKSSIDKIKWSIVFLFAFLSSFFAGHLQTFFYVLVFSFVYFLFKLVFDKKKFKNLLLFSALGIVFILVSSIQLIPTLNFIFLSARSLDQSWLSPGWFMPWQNIIQFLIPDFFGNPATLNYWGIWNYGEFVGYVGIVSIIFALFAIFRKDKKTLFFFGAVVVSLLFALPTPLAKIPYKLSLPFLSTAQPTRLIFVIDFCLSVLAALGFDHFLKTEKVKKIYYILGLLFLIFVSLWLYVLKFSKGISTSDILVSKQNLIFPTILFISTSIVIFLISVIPQKNKYRGNFLKLFSFVLIIVLIADLLRFGWKYTPFTSKDYLYPTTKTISFLEENLGNYRIMETDSEILPPNFSNIYKFQSVDGYDPLYLQSYAEFAAAWGRNIPSISTPFGFNRIITPENYNLNFINLLGVKYVLSFNPIISPYFKVVFSEGKTKVYENTNVVPRVFFIGRTVYAKNKQTVINLMFDNNYPLKYRAVVEDATNKNFSRTWGVGSAKIVEYQENKVIVDTQNQAEGFLILTDSYYPTWHVTIDGKEAKIYRTDYNFRGVIVPKGEHSLEFYISIL